MFLGLYKELFLQKAVEAHLDMVDMVLLGSGVDACLASPLSIR